MAKRLLLNLLVKVLGEFVELDEDNLSWAVWAGQIKLHNLRLKTENILKGYQFKIYHGIIQTLEVVIPWGSFLVNPWKIKLSGVLLDLGPLDLSQVAKEDILKSMLERKLQKLALVDQYLELSQVVSSSTGSEKQANNGNNESYIQHWTSQIIDNLEVALSDIHVRYEDHITIPGQVFAAGFTLESFVLCTCNGDWQPAFVVKSNKPDAFVNKMATLNNLGIYWEPTSEVLSDLPLESWKKHMLDLIHRTRASVTESQPADSLHYILAPSDNSMVLKLVHRPNPTEGSFRYEVRLESKNTLLTLDSQQFQQIFQFYYRIDALRNIYDPQNYRPAQRATASPEFARRWWRYAKTLALAQPKYVRLVKLYKKAEVEDVLPDILMTSEDIKEMQKLERRLPLSVLQAFRQKALKELIEESKSEKLHGDSEKSSSSGSWWGGWYSNRKSLGGGASGKGGDSGVSGVSGGEDDISLKTLIQEGEKKDFSPSDLSLSLKVTIHASSALALQHNFQPILEARMAFTTSVQTSQGRWKVSSEVTDVHVADTLHDIGLVPALISVRSLSNKSVHMQSKPTLSVSIEKVAHKTKVVMTALPVEIFVNKHCIHSVLLAFTIPKNSVERKLRRVFTIHRSEGSQFLQQAVLAGTRLSSQVMEEIATNQNINVEISLQMHGPKIIIPEDCKADKGCLLLDCGFLSTEAKLYSNGLSLDLSLHAINVGLPLSVHDFHSMMEQQLYLIKPFDLKIEFQTIVKEIADSTANVSIEPELRGEIDSIKVGRLLRILTGLSDIASPARAEVKAMDVDVETVIAQSIFTTPEPKVKTRTMFSRDSDVEQDESDSDGYLTPQQMPNSASPEVHSRGRKSIDRQDTMKTTPLMAQLRQSLQRASSVTINNLMKSSEGGDSRDPTNVDMRIGFNLPLLILDSTYDAAHGHHIIIAVRGLLLDVVNRPYDRTIVFDVNEFSVQDSFRHESQKYVVWTPPSEKSLIHVHFLSINNTASPLYRSHASEVTAVFTELYLNVDVNTLSHLQPLVSQLLDKRNRASPAVAAALSTPKKREDAQHDLTVADVAATPIANDHSEEDSGVLANAATNGVNESNGLSGMKISMSMSKLCVDLLKPMSEDRPKAELLRAFCMRMVGMDVRIEMFDLMKAKMRLRTFEIDDVRPSSKEHFFKTIFCPILEDKGMLESDEDAEDRNVLLYLTYSQETKTNSFMTVKFSGMNSFVAIDTMLEFSQLAMGNFFAFTGLLSSPSPPPPPSSNGEYSLVEASDSLLTSAGKNPLIKCSTMNATVSMVNSQLILLEDPAMRESQAIVGKCALSVHFTREVKNYLSTTEMSESLHVTVTGNEISVRKNMVYDITMPILEPFDVECHIKRTVVNNSTVYTSLQLEIDDVDARLSFNDLLLAQAILSRRALVDGSSSSSTSSTGNANNQNTPSESTITIEEKEVAENRVTDVNDVDKGEEEEEERSDTLEASSSRLEFVPPTIMIRFGLHTLRVVVVNDFNTASVPITRLEIYNSNFYSEGMINQLNGEGSAQMKLDYFNARIATWEPCIESWTPAFKVMSQKLSNTFEIRSDRTLQVTISGSMLETLLRSYTLFFHDLGENRVKDSVNGILVNNLLGDGLKVSIFDSLSKEELCQIECDGQGIVTEVMDVSVRAVRTFRLPEAVDVVITGEALLSPRVPIVHLPFNITKPKACFLQPAVESEDKKQSISGSSSGNKAYLLEPIEEEVFENCRYDPISGAWRKPFFPGDPYEWTDATGLVRKDFDSVEINSTLWEWSSHWEVDMDGIVGQEIDELGWEYAASFNYFTMVSPRRTFQALDCVRRRRWIRTRSPKIGPDQLSLRSLTVFWDVEPLLNGTRKVDIRSSFQIRNNLGFAIRIRLAHHSWGNEDYEVSDTLAVGAVYNVPLMKSYATHVSFKPDFPGYSWSAYVPCNVHSYDCKVVKEMMCKAEDASSVAFRSWTIHENKAVEVILLPYISINNKLLCGMEYRLTSTDGKEEMGEISSGCIAHSSYVNLFNAPRISIRMGRYPWSRDFQLNTKTEQNGLLIMQNESKQNESNNLPAGQSTSASSAVSSSSSYSLLPVCIRTELDKNYCLQIDIFFQVALIDLSGLNLIAKARFNNSQDLISHLSDVEQRKWSLGLSSSSSNNKRTLDNARNTSPRPSNPSTKLLTGLTCGSNWQYEIATVDLGSNVYVDNNTKWTHLPWSLRGQLFLRTAFVDKLSRSSSFLSFQAMDEVVVFVLVDVNTSLKWLITSNFKKCSEIAVARRKLKGKWLEYHYYIYGKVYQRGDQVILQGAWDRNILCMYSIAIVSTASLSLSSRSSSNNNSHLTSNQNEEEEIFNSPQRRSSLIEEALFASQVSEKDIESCWIDGGNYATAFYSEDNLLVVKTTNEESWSDQINIDTRSNSSTKGSFEIISYRNGLSYQLSYTMQNLPGLYHQTQLIKFMPRYCLLNCTDEPLLISQKGSNKYTEYLPYHPEGWHIVDNQYGTTEVKLRTSHTLWSLGCVNLNEVGSSLLYIPLADNTINNSNEIWTTTDIGSAGSVGNAGSSNGSGGSRGVVLHVEVKLATPEDHCSILILVWKENIESHATLSIENSSDVPITIRQTDIEYYHDIGDKLSLYELTVPAGKHLPFGWTDPECGANIQVAVGTSLSSPANAVNSGLNNKRVATLNMLKAGQRLRLPYSNYQKKSSAAVMGEIILDVTTSDAGRVLHVSRPTASLFQPISSESGIVEDQIGEDGNTTQTSTAVVPTTLFNFHILFTSLGISLVVEKPTRRELFSLYMDYIDLLFQSKGPIKSFKLSVLDLQLDNYSESAVYPILLRSTKKEIHNSIAMVEDEDEDMAHIVRDKSEDLQEDDNNNNTNKQSNQESDLVPGEKSFIELSIVTEQPQSAQKPIVKYFAFRILSVVVQVDSATMHLLFLDLLDDLKVLTISQALAINRPGRWLADFNQAVFQPASQKWIDIYLSKASSLQSKMYIKKMIIHPMKITITFFQTPFPRRQKKETLQSTVLNAMMSLVGVENMQIRLNSFEVEDAMESIDTLASLITARAVQDIQLQVASIVGSIAALGAPVGLARKVGRGVRAFFYEPYLGAVHGPHLFMTGLNKGTQRLFREVVVGGLGSAVAIVGTASRGMAYLTGDQEFVRKRAVKRQQNRAQSGGLYGGIIDGGESLISGISSGVKGLIAKPIEEAASGGITGFFKGIGLGMLGAAVKPIVGFAEGVTSIASGLSNQIDTLNKLVHVRPPRALQPSTADSTLLVIVPLNLEAAFAQDFVVKRARQEHYQDSFLSYLSLGIKGEALILSETYMFWRRHRSLWGRLWANVSHCVFNNDSVGIMLYSGSASRVEAEVVIIPCGSVKHARRVYASLAQNAYRMGNPMKVLPVDLLPSLPSSGGLFSDSFTSSKSELSLLSISSDKVSSRPSVETCRERLLEEASRLSELDGYRFGSVNGRILTQIQGSENDVISRWQYYVQRGCRSWRELDEYIWSLLWEWGCIHANFSSCRCCVTLFINNSDSPIQITRVQMLSGRKVVIAGSDATGYELESRLLRPKGFVVVFITAFPQSPLEIGHLKANINTVAFTATLASTQRETRCEAKGGFTTGFLEKTVTEWWSKYVILTT